MKTTVMDRENLVTVYLQKVQRYDIKVLVAFIEECMPRGDLPSLRGATVLLKPNLISAHGQGLACTHPSFLLALAEWFQCAGSRVVVGDSPAFGRAATVLRRLGVDREFAQRGVGVVEFKTTLSRRLNCGVEVGIAAESLECDLFVNVPKLKAHNQMYVTIAVKNLFGIIKGMRKTMLHMHYGDKNSMFSRVILDLIGLLPANVSVVDGIEVMHEQGPLRGSSLALGCAAVSLDPIALDTTFLEALELKKRMSPLWREAEKRGCPGADIAHIHFPLLRPQHFHGSHFEAPSQLAPIRFNPLRFLYGNVKRIGLKISGQ